MENTNHVKSNFLIKLPFLLIFLPFFVIYSLFIFFLNLRYKNKKAYPIKKRYKRTFKWFNWFSNFWNIDYLFINKSKLIKTQCIFLTKSNLDWKQMYILAWLFESNLHRPFVSMYFQKNKSFIFNWFLSLIDNIKNENDLEQTYKNKKSIYCFLNDENLGKIFNLINKHCVPVVILKIEEKKKKFGSQITVEFVKSFKSHDFLNFDKSSLIKKINNYF